MSKEDKSKLSEYNHHVVKKLFSIAGNYKIWFLAAMAALVFSTAFELILPVLMQRTIDRYVISDWSYLPGQASAVGADLYIEKEGLLYQSGEDLYVLTSELPSLDLKDSDRGPWLVFRLTEEVSSLLSSSGLSPAVMDDSSRGALSKNDLETLDRDIYRTLRTEDLEGLKKNSLVYFALLCLILIFSFVQMYNMAWTSQGVMKNLRVRMLSHTMKQSLGYLGDTPVGTLVSRITSDVETINEFFTSVTISVLKDLTIMAGVLVTLYILNPRLALITIITTPPVLIMTGVFRRLARTAYRKQRFWIGKVNGFISEHLTGMEVIQIFGQEGNTKKNFRDNNRNLLKASLNEMYVFAVFRPLVDMFTSVSLGVVIYAGAGMFNRGILTLGVLIAFIDLIQKFYRPVMDLSEKFTIMQSAMAGGERIFQLLDEDYSIPDRGSLPSGSYGEGKIDFRNVRFAYKKEDYVLKDLSFSVKAGETAAIVGYTGAGKTTIASLAARLWDIQSGEILLDNRNITDIPLQDLRNTVQAVQQDVFLFSGTVLENITLGLEVPFERVLEASRRVQADSFIQQMDKGYESHVQERGANLSAGQRQLIAFARILVHDPKVVILDEATANIDSETEKLVQNAIDQVLKDRTSLVIAHRISTIQKADRILVLSQGELVEQGTHEELLDKQGLYFSLYKLQYENGNPRDQD